VETVEVLNTIQQNTPADRLNLPYYGCILCDG